LTHRNDQISDFLAKNGISQWQKNALASDASPRKYIRLRDGNQSRILMDADPETVSSTAQFVKIANLLRDNGLAAPELYDVDLERGLVLMQDLGENTVHNWIHTNPDQEADLYRAILPILIKIAQINPPSDLMTLTPQVGADMLEPLFTHHLSLSPSDLSQHIQTLMQDLLIKHAGPANTLSLRDFHSENLIWRPQLFEPGNIGLLDFQDAFVAPLCYDLVSLITDARRDVPTEIANDLIQSFATQSNLNIDQFDLACRVVSIQRNLRIVGIFKRLANDGKTKYLTFIPRVLSYIALSLQRSELSELQRDLSLSGLFDQ
jgi:aminoglycoside/choline kinase family phosphotransferase